MISNALHEQSSEELLQLAGKYLAHSQPRQAEALCEEILKRDSEDPNALTLLASIAYQAGSDILAEAYLSRALEIFEEILEKYPNNSSANLKRSTILLAQGRKEEALPHIAQLDLPLETQDGPQEDFFKRFQSGIARGIPLSLIFGTPYSGADGLAFILARGLDIANGTITIGTFPHSEIIPSQLSVAKQGGLVSAVHVKPSPQTLELLQVSNVGKAIGVIRDPRAITLSWAEGFLHHGTVSATLPLNRDVYPPRHTLRQGRAALLDWCIETFLPSVLDHIDAWIRFEEQYKDSLDIHWLTQEDLSRDPLGTVNRVLDHLAISQDEFSVLRAKLPPRTAPQELETWRQNLSPKQLKRASEMLPDSLVKRFAWKL